MGQLTKRGSTEMSPSVRSKDHTTLAAQSLIGKQVPSRCANSVLEQVIFVFYVEIALIWNYSTGEGGNKMKNLILVFPHGDLKTPQTKIQAAGQTG